MQRGVVEETREAPRQRGVRLVELKPYDIRHDQERGTRRHLAQRTRGLLRVGTLLALDSAVAFGTLALALTGAKLDAQVVVTLLPVAVLSLLSFNAYGPGTGRADGYARLLAVFVTGGVVALQLPLLPTLGGIPWERLLLAWLPLFYLALEAERALVGRAISALRRRHHLLRPALLVGTRAELERIQGELADVPHGDMLLVGYVAPPGSEDTTGLGALDQLEDVIHEHDVRVVIVSESVPPAMLPRLIARIYQSGASLLAVPSTAAREAAAQAGYPVVAPGQLEFSPAALPLPQLGVKRALDLLLTIVALLILSPLLIVISMAIRFDSPGPVLFRQTRVGVGGRTFQIFKFRTMVADAEARQPALAHLNQYDDARLFKIVDDPRVTRVGRWLRRSSLDEVPQLFNVLRGEMSLVGPRPPLPAEVAVYNPDHFVRLSVMPGVTGPWQANGRNNVRSFDEVVRMEHEYIRNWSLALDLRILFRTIGAVLRRDGAH